MFDRLYLAILTRVGGSAGWRIVRVLHAIPYLAAAWCFGWASGWFWQAPMFTPAVSAWLLCGAVAFLMCCTWLKEWWRG